MQIQLRKVSVSKKKDTVTVAHRFVKNEIMVRRKPLYGVVGGESER
jgi:hypothetical protein